MRLAQKLQKPQSMAPSLHDGMALHGRKVLWLRLGSTDKLRFQGRNGNLGRRAKIDKLKSSRDSIMAARFFGSRLARVGRG